MTTDLFVEWKNIPLYNFYFEISQHGIILLEDSTEITLVDFNNLTGLEVDSVAVLVGLSYSNIKIAPVYWKKLEALYLNGCVISPENIVLGFKHPIESLEYPGFYLIPYYSNYLITRTGILLKKNEREKIVASETKLGYFTFRMNNDSNNTQNRLRHRILCMAFKKYPANMEDLDINHLNGIKGDDRLDNLEWVTRSENSLHAYTFGLRFDNKRIAVKDVNSKVVRFFHSCSQAARHFNVTQTTISNRAKTMGLTVYNGYQFRFLEDGCDFPEVEGHGDFIAELEDGTTKQCDGVEAARLAGVTRTSLLRILREGRNKGKTNVAIYKKI